jgi:hypothetical protein
MDQPLSQGIPHGPAFKLWEPHGPALIVNEHKNQIITLDAMIE